MALPACFALLALTTLAAGASGPQDNPPVRYKVHVLETLGGSTPGFHQQGVAINENGEVVGTIVYNGRALAAHWTAAGELTLLYTGEPGSNSFVNDLTNDGLAVGYSVVRRDTTAFQWSAATGTQPLDLGSGGVPLAVDAAHTIAYTFRSEEVLASALLQVGGGVTAIGGVAGDVLVRDLNALGAATGIVGGGATLARPFLWTAAGGTVLLDLPSGFDQGHGNALNSAGVVVGVSRTEARDQATRWDTPTTPTLLPYLRPSDTQSSAFAVNAQGWIAGIEFAAPDSSDVSTGVLWIDGDAWGLDVLASGGAQEPDHYTITAALDINDKGQVAARGTVNGVERPLRLDPW